MISKLYIDKYIDNDGGFSLSDLNVFLDNLEAEVNEIEIYINSGGGSVIEGFGIYDKLKGWSGKITTIAEGMVGSIATVIFMAGSERKIYPNTDFFIHNPYTFSHDSLTANGARLLSEDLQAAENKILAFYEKTTGTGSDIIKPLMDKATTLTAKQAKDFNFVTEIIGEDVVNKHKYKLVAYLNKNEEKQMDEKLTLISKFLAKIEKFMKPQIKNEMTKLDGDVVIYHDGIIAVGVAVFEDEAMTVALQDGSYIAENGDSIVVSEGLISEIIVAEIAALKSELAALKAEKMANDAELINKKKQVDSIKAEFIVLKDSLSSEPIVPKVKNNSIAAKMALISNSKNNR